MIEFIVDVFKYAVAIVLSGIIVSVIPVLRDFLVSKFKLSLDKQLEKSKAANERKNYVSKVRFDAEFEIYRSLSKAFNNLLNNLAMLYNRRFEIPISQNEKNKYIDDLISDCADSYTKACNTLWENAPFISEEIYEYYFEILIECHRLHVQACQFYGVILPRIAKIDDNTYEKMNGTEQKMLNLNKIIREYLYSLEAI